jgi:hypothetical protein
MNPKEVSYSHPQLPLCDTPICVPTQSFTGIETQKYRFFENMQEVAQKKLFLFSASQLFSAHLRCCFFHPQLDLHQVVVGFKPLISFFHFYVKQRRF